MCLMTFITHFQMFLQPLPILSLYFPSFLLNSFFTQAAFKQSQVFLLSRFFAFLKQFNLLINAWSVVINQKLIWLRLQQLFLTFFVHFRQVFFQSCCTFSLKKLNSYMRLERERFLIKVENKFHGVSPRKIRNGWHWPCKQKTSICWRVNWDRISTTQRYFYCIAFNPKHHNAVEQAGHGPRLTNNVQRGQRRLLLDAPLLLDLPVHHPVPAHSVLAQNVKHFPHDSISSTHLVFMQCNQERFKLVPFPRYHFDYSFSRER